MDELQRSKKRSISYWFEDGLSEMGTGLVILMIGLMLLLVSLLPEHSGWGWPVAIGQPLVIIGAFYGAGKLVKYFKEKITYPRTGFVSYPRRQMNQRLKRGVLTGMIAAAISIGVTLLSGVLSQRFVPLFVSVLLGLSFLFLAVYYGAKRFFIICVFEPLIGALLCWLNLPDPLDSAWLFMGTGICMMLTGFGGLLHYLHVTRPAGQEELE